ncbi:hypothetical protein HanPI659440_Chr14g0541851 [Helianthus annuus]|nr:hypothetical protein HanPI659440_Chr14g0541851 [Helianthus annuus]
MLIFVGCGFCSPSRLNIEACIRLMLAPRSANVLLIGDPPMEQGMVKLLGSIFFCGSLLRCAAEHSSLKLTCWMDSIFLLWVRKSLMSLEYFSICVRTCLSRLTNLVNCSSVFFRSKRPG